MADSEEDGRKEQLKETSQDTSDRVMMALNVNTLTGGVVEKDKETNIKKYKYYQADYERRDIDFNFANIEDEKKACEARIQANSEDVEALVKLGYIEIRYFKNKESAMKCFLSVLELNEDDLDGLLGRCYCVLEDKKKHEFNWCQEQLDICYDQSISYWRIDYYQAMLCYLRYDDYRCKLILRKALCLKPDHYLSTSLLALINSEIKSDLNKAKVMIDDLLERKEGFNNDFSVYYRAGKIYEKLKLADQSIEFFQLSAKYRVEYSQAIKMVSFVYMTLKQDLETAEKFALKAIEIDPTNDEAFMNLGEIYERKGMFQEAKKQLAKAIEVNPQNDTAYMLTLDLYEQMGGKSNKFHNLCQKFVENNPDSADANFELAYSYSIQKNPFESIRYYKKSLQQQVLVDSYSNLGNVYFQLEDLEEAEEHFIKALDYDTEDELFNQNLNIVVQHSLFKEQGGVYDEELDEDADDWEDGENGEGSDNETDQQIENGNPPEVNINPTVENSNRILDLD